MPRYALARLAESPARSCWWGAEPGPATRSAWSAREANDTGSEAEPNRFSCASDSVTTIGFRASFDHPIAAARGAGSLVAGLGRGAIADADEAFYAESAREMVESGDWLTPHYNYEPRFQKPALYYWLAAGTSLVTRPDRVVRATVVGSRRRSGWCWSSRPAAAGGLTNAPDCWPARSPRPASATSRWRAWRCPICRWRSSSRSRSGPRSSRRSIASAIRDAGCCSRPRAAALGFLDERAGRPHHSRAGRGAGAADRAAVVQRAARRSRACARLVFAIIAVPVVRRDVDAARHAPISRVLRRRQLRAIRDRTLQRSAAVVVLSAGAGRAVCCRGRR